MATNDGAERGLTGAEARRFYDRFGSRQDRQSWYEGAALHRLVGHSRFDGAQRVLELGCGTGRFAAELLAEHLPHDARLVAVDQSATMVALAHVRLAPWPERARVVLSNGEASLPFPDRSFDRFVSTYVFDLLQRDATVALVKEAERLLIEDGRLCLAGLGPGDTLPSRVIGHLWGALHRLRPALVGGCRPRSMRALLEDRGWRIEAIETVTAWGLASEVLVARTPIDSGGARSAG